MFKKNLIAFILGITGFVFIISSPAKDVTTNITLVTGFFFVLISQFALFILLKREEYNKIQISGLNRLSILGSILTILGMLFGNFTAPFLVPLFGFYIILAFISICTLFLSFDRSRNQIIELQALGVSFT
ncbi:MAG: hypothetical protein ACXAD7_14480 [Candidatus Kariarchaeaceae archaeon]